MTRRRSCTPTPSRASTCCGPALDCKSTSARTIRTPPLSRSSIKKVSSRGKNEYEPPRTFEIPDWVGSAAVAASNTAQRAKCSRSAGGDREYDPSSGLQRYWQLSSQSDTSSDTELSLCILHVVC